MIGDLDEVVFVVRPLWGKSRSTDGTLYFDADFYKLTFLEKNYTFAKVSLLILIGFFISLACSMLFRLLGANRTGSRSDAGIRRIGPISSGLRRDFVYGLVGVLMAGTALAISSLGAIKPLDVGFKLGFLGIGILGAVIAQLLKLSLTGKNLTTL